MKSFIKKLLPRNSWLYSVISKFYRSLFKIWLPEKISVQESLHNYALHNKNVCFIQIGSNDGVTGDPLHNFIIQHKWTGILVEPVPYLYKRLKKNYEQYDQNNFNKLNFENAALSGHNGVAKFYRLKEQHNSNVPFWYDQIGSFDKNVIMAHSSMSNFNDLLIEEDVNTITFKSLLQKYALQRVDLIHIDTEGYDFEILKMVDFVALTPDIIIYEYIHLSLSDFKKSLSLLKRNGYKLYSSYLDIVAINKNYKNN